MEPRWIVHRARASRLVVLAGLFLTPTLAEICLAQLPATHLDGVYPAGGRPGETIDVTLAGTNLDDVQQLWFSHPGFTAERKMAEPGPFDRGPQPVPDQFVLRIAADVPPGQYDVRALGLYGLSNPRVFEVGTLPEVAEKEPNSAGEEAQEISVPGVVNGQVNGAADVDYFRFVAQAGERMIVRCAARALDSPLDAVVRVVDGEGRVLAESRDGQAFDPLADFTVPASGTFQVMVFDALYGGSPGHIYRLSVGRLPQVDFVLPPAVLPGTTASLTVFGRNLPGGEPSGLSVEGRMLEKKSIQVAMPADLGGQLPLLVRVESHQAALDGIPLPLDGGALPVNSRLVYAATAPVALEREGNNEPASAQPLTLPGEVAGQFYPARDVDWFTFEARQGEPLILDLYANRLGMPCDAMLHIERVTRSEEGKEQITSVADVGASDQRDGGHEFDARSGDPFYSFIAPADGTYRVLVRETYSALHSDPRLVYRLAVRRPRPDFRLVAVPFNSHEALLLRQGSRDAIRVLAFRQDDFRGEIRVSLTGLPAGVTATEAVIGPASNAATITVTAAEDAAPAEATLQISGRANVEGQEVTRIARTGAADVGGGLPQPGQQMPSVRARLTRGLVLSISKEEKAPAMLAIGDEKVWETARGGILKVPYSVVRRDNFNGSITGVVLDLPPTFNPPQVGIGNAASGEFQLNLPGDMPTGTYSFVVHGFVQGYQYSRNPAAAKAAAERKAELEQVVAEVNEKVKQATEGRNAAQQAVEQAQAVLQQAMAAAVEADIAAAREKVTAAEAAKTAAENALREVMDLAGRAQQARQAAEQRAQQLENQARPQNVNYWTPSTPLTVRIGESPVTTDGIPPRAVVRPSASLEIPLRVTRLYGFDGPVNYNWQVPGGVGGVQFGNVQIPQGQTEGKLMVTAAQDANPGSYAIRLQTQLNFNGQNVTVDTPLELVVEAAPTQN